MTHPDGADTPRAFPRVAALRHGEMTHSPHIQTGESMDTNIETDELARVALGGRARHNTRIRRALLARLLNEQDGASSDGVGGDDAADEDQDEDRQLIQALVGTRLVHKRRLRKLLKAKLVKERADGSDDYDEGNEDSGEGTEDEQELGRLLIGSRMLRRRRVRRALLAALVRERAGADDSDEGTDDSEEDGGDREGKFIRLVIGSGVLRRRRVRRALLAHLVKDRGEASFDSDEGEDSDDDGADLEREVARLLVGVRVVRRRRMRGAAVRHAHNGDDF